MKTYDVRKNVRKANGEWEDIYFPGVDEVCMKQFIKGYRLADEFMGSKLYISRGGRISYEIEERR